MKGGFRWYRKVATHLFVYISVAAFIGIGLVRLNNWAEVHDWRSRATFYLFQVLPENQAFYLAEKLGTVDVISCGPPRKVVLSVSRSMLFNSPYIQSLESGEELINCRLRTEFPDPGLSISVHDETGLNFEPSFKFPE